ncbi:PPC domain-containing protein [Abeliophyllum distichum]|uniref:PPC domain-containing protein n=1 Tax=Abeliophyllum distichum TaxID=126358 RepID=A0ABD1VQF2_9LAMI
MRRRNDPGRPWVLGHESRSHNSEDEHNKTSGLNMGQKQNRDKGKNETNMNTGKSEENDVMEMGGEMTRRPRGRPTGSKNKPKPPNEIGKWTKLPFICVTNHVVEMS